jgi:xanthine phosphoribosyltransferase
MAKDRQGTLELDWKGVQMAVDEIAKQAKEIQWDTVIAIMRGGMVPARLVAAELGVENIVIWDRGYGMLGKVKGRALIVDDIADTGTTVRAAKAEFGLPMAVLVSKVDGAEYEGLRLKPDDKRWVIFPWEGRADKLYTRQSLEVK